MERSYIAIDLKSFYASVECNERGLDPLTTNLVVADKSRTDKTICLAVSPSLKSFGVSSRPRLFEVLRKVEEINAERRMKAPGHKLVGESNDLNELKSHPETALSFIVATPRMAYYLEYSTLVYSVYLKYIAPEDIHVYSIDEVFIDATKYLRTYGMTPHELAMTMIRDVLRETGITATAGIGTNLYLSKVAMDIVAKKLPADKDGVRIAELDEMSYRRELWDHRPLSSFWRIGRGISSRLEAKGIRTMGDIARTSLTKRGEDMLYRMFGINAELLIDHAWGWEPCRMEDIKAYRPGSSSLSSGQVLPRPYSFEKAKLVTREMTDLLVLDLSEKKLATDQIVLTIGYESLDSQNINSLEAYEGEVSDDWYGRKVPKRSHGTVNLDRKTFSTMLIEEAVMDLYDRIVDKDLYIRRINVTACRLVSEGILNEENSCEQLSMLDQINGKAEDLQQKELAKERRRQEAVLRIKQKFGKNSILRGMDLDEDATTIARNCQIGGHKA